MKIEINKKYISAIGEIVSIINKVDDYYVSVKNDEYYENGNFLFDNVECEYDLICEVVDSILYEYNLGILTQKEFIEEHIRHWSKK